MNPDLEVVDVLQHESFKVWGHGYPYRTVRWHFHPEYEIQLITQTSGQYFVGDFIGNFQPGNLVFMAPNLPHNWVSDVPEGEVVPRRNLIVQFSDSFLTERLLTLPELRYLNTLINESKRGVLFSQQTGEKALPIMEELLGASGCRRLVLFLSLIDLISQDKNKKMLASARFSLASADYMSSTINQALSFIDQNLANDLRETDLAKLTGRSPCAFSRLFKKHTGTTFSQHVNHLRIHQACKLLVDGNLSITEICFKVGFNNVSNFNRHFLAQKGVSPRRFRALYQLNITSQNCLVTQ